jgi:hypothetical protein
MNPLPDWFEARLAPPFLKLRQTLLEGVGHRAVVPERTRSAQREHEDFPPDRRLMAGGSTLLASQHVAQVCSHIGESPPGMKACGTPTDSKVK